MAPKFSFILLVALSLAYLSLCTLYVLRPAIKDHLYCKDPREASARVTSVNGGTEEPEIAEFLQRAQRQQDVVDRICRLFDVERVFQSEPMLLSSWNNHTYQYLLSHLWYDDIAHNIYCALPKVASTTMNQYFLLLNGILSEKNVSVSRPPPSVLKLVKTLSGTNASEQLHHMGGYYLFTTIRNPLERLVSGYRDKLSRAQISWYESMQADILQRFRPKVFDSWIQDNKSYELRPTFKEFIEYFLSMKLDDLDHHFRPFLDVCYPCIVRYNYYLHLNSMDKDLKIIASQMKWNISLNSLEHTIDHPEVNTTQIVPGYYRRLPRSLRKTLKSRLRYELEFYYSLYPEERKRDAILL